ncbi:hypothetical protein B0H16DRAFT_1508901 [Mycena metata]|uniref:FAD/NAD(P)-binding domain-containing protein n=1 Tax=Mycena metata TaxID=1033252 RepID=A0AAD7K160_9AGAR|nr:hypothetical protein B0H16DRAFT_1508901 [Mycena metata]
MTHHRPTLYLNSVPPSTTPLILRMDAFWSFYNFKQLRVVVVGGASTGLAAAVALRRAGHLVEIYAPDLGALGSDPRLEMATSIEEKGTPCKIFANHVCDKIGAVSGIVTFKNGVTLTADLIIDTRVPASSASDSTGNTTVNFIYSLDEQNSCIPVVLFRKQSLFLQQRFASDRGCCCDTGNHFLRQE